MIKDYDTSAEVCNIVTELKYIPRPLLMNVVNKLVWVEKVERLFARINTVYL